MTGLAPGGLKEVQAGKLDPHGVKRPSGPAFCFLAE